MFLSFYGAIQLTLIFSSLKINLHLWCPLYFNLRKSISWKWHLIITKLLYPSEDSWSEGSLNLTSSGILANIPDEVKFKDPSDQESSDGYNNFVIIRCHFHEIDFLKLKYSGHQRCKFIFNEENIKVNWIAP